MIAGGDHEERPVFAAELGVVLCGGESRRMGRDKAELAVGGTTLLRRAVECLQRVTPEVVLACGPLERYGALGIERVLDPEPGLGPIGGLWAGFVRLARRGTDPGRSTLYALACDMPFVEPHVFRTLAGRLADDGADAVLLRSAGGVEPLLAVYRGSLLPAVERAVRRGDRRLVAFHGEAAVVELDQRDVADAPEGCATNVNTPEEFRAIGGRLA